MRAKTLGQLEKKKKKPTELEVFDIAKLSLRPVSFEENDRGFESAFESLEAMASTTTSERKHSFTPSQPLAIDIGGSFTKMVYFRPEDPPELPSYVLKEEPALGSKLPVVGDDSLTMTVDEAGATLRFLRFPSTRLVDFIKFVLNHDLHAKYGRKIDCVNATGGGAHKYAQVVQESLGCLLVQQDEMASLVRGLNFLISTCDSEIFTFDQGRRREFQKHEVLYPCMLVNIGSGVSIIRIDGEDQYTRVSGSSIGGGTFWGLCKQLTGVESYQEILRLCAEGDNSSVDLLVGDIYGGAYTQLGLAPDVIASSFAKCGLAHPDEDFPNAPSPVSPQKPQDVARSILYLVANNITQIAYLNARLHNAKQIFFTGGFVQDNQVLWERITFGLQFWSSGEMRANFLLHDGYLGALGSLLAESKR